MSSPPKIIPNLINTLLDWTNQYELDDLTLTAHKKLILDFRESLEGLQDSMKKLKNLHDTQTDGYLKFALGESVTIGEDDESRVKDFIENVCEEMVAWKLTEDTEVIDLEEDMDDENGLYDRIFKNSTKLKELISGIKERNQDRREVIGRHWKPFT